MVVFVHVDDILAHAQATMERFSAELGEKFKVKPVVEKFVVEKTGRTPVSSGVSNLSPSESAEPPEKDEDMLNFLYRETVEVFM